MGKARAWASASSMKKSKKKKNTENCKKKVTKKGKR